MIVTTTNYNEYFITKTDITKAFLAPKITSTDKYFKIEKVIFNDPATIVFWADGTKTVVKCGEEDVYDYQTGLLMCIAKKAFGNKGKFNDILREWIPEEEEEEDDGFSIRKLFGIPKTYTFEAELTPELRENFERLARSSFNPVLSGYVYGGKADA